MAIGEGDGLEASWRRSLEVVPCALRRKPRSLLETTRDRCLNSSMGGLRLSVIGFDAVVWVTDISEQTS